MIGVPGGDGRPRVAVLGAGVCGLYAARTLARGGATVTVLEREDVVGGLAAGREIDGNYYDLGVHHLHEFDREILEDVRRLMGDRLIAVPKRALIRYGRGYRRYPLEFGDLLLGIPPHVLVTALLGLVAQQVRNRLSTRQAADAEEALVQLYGRPLYAYFFRDFTHRYWGVAPELLSATFVRRKMPRLSAVDVIKKALSRVGVREVADSAVESALADETLHYARTGARELPMALADALVASGGSVRLGATVTAVEAGGNRVTAVRYRTSAGEERLECDACVSTIPITALVRALEPAAPPPVLGAADRLRYRPLVVYGLLVRRPRVLDALYVYYRNRVFHRLAEPSASGMVVRPEGHTVLLVEMTCDLGDDRWTGGAETRRRVLDDLETEGLLRADEVVDVHVLRNEHGYPVFDVGFEPHLAAIEAHLDTFANLYSTGRQGAFTYPNMHGAMRMGANAAEQALAARHHVHPEGWRQPLLDEGGVGLAGAAAVEPADVGVAPGAPETPAAEPTALEPATTTI